MNFKVNFHLAKQKMILVITFFVFEVCMSVHGVVSDTESEIVEGVTRQQSSDLYYFINSSSTGDSCGYENTYLISENQCVKDKELFRGNFI